MGLKCMVIVSNSSLIDVMMVFFFHPFYGRPIHIFHFSYVQRDLHDIFKFQIFLENVSLTKTLVLVV
jgi:hypothetical protein